MIHHIVAEQDFAEPRPVHLHARISLVALDGGGSSEDHAAAAAADHFGADVPESRINRDGLLGHTGHGKSGGHAVRCPGLLRAGLEQQSDLHRDDGQP